MNFCVQDFMWYVFSSLKTLHFVELLAHRVTISAKGFSGGSGGKASACSAGDLGSIPGSGGSPGEGSGTHSSTLAWRVPRTGEPSRLQSMGSQRVRHD